jgi:hypothetical protein
VGGGGGGARVPPGFQSSIKCRTMFKTTLGLGLGSAKSSDLNVSQKTAISTVSTGKKITACLSSHFREINLNVGLFFKTGIFENFGEEKETVLSEAFTTKIWPGNKKCATVILCYCIVLL